MSTFKVFRDFLRLITFCMDDYRTIMNASMTCKTWRRVVNECLPKLMQKGNIDVCFKITRVRFLLEKGLRNLASAEAKKYHAKNGKHQSFQVVICDRPEEYIIVPIEAVSEDDKFIVYESNYLFPAWRLKSLKWLILEHFYNPHGPKADRWRWVPYFGCDNFHGRKLQCESASQSPNTDLSWQLFDIGKKYKRKDEQVVIGSNELPYHPIVDILENTFRCCCAITLLPPDEVTSVKRMRVSNLTN